MLTALVGKSFLNFQLYFLNIKLNCLNNAELFLFTLIGSLLKSCTSYHYQSFIQRSTMFLFSPLMTYSPIYNILYRRDFFRIPLLHIDINMNIMPKYSEY